MSFLIQLPVRYFPSRFRSDAEEDDSGFLKLLFSPTNLKLSPNVKLTSDISLNMPPICDTFDISRLVRFKLISDELPLNIPLISFTFFVLNDFRSNDVRLVQKRNISSMLLTSSVLKFDKSNAVSALHPSNILDMSVTSEVSRFVNPFISVKFFSDLNNAVVLSGALVALVKTIFLILSSAIFLSSFLFQGAFSVLSKLPGPMVKIPVVLSKLHDAYPQRRG
ncbi:hypothetical protein RU86_GL001937 [Lactococcus piscium]|uniref:Uncharacterized protein n=1 Tax=Pseudolactococcus piscium TaxID=1364 RepID=A0A2A5RTA0_9LACT|nr:hypothetical protein RU86_GL001937 [Lactococcus piscium]